MPSEDSIVQSIKRWAKSMGGLAFKIRGDQYMRGFPDLILIVPNPVSERADVAFVEVKRKGEDPTAIQQAVIDTLNDIGANAFVARSAADCESSLA